MVLARLAPVTDNITDAIKHLQHRGCSGGLRFDPLIICLGNKAQMVIRCDIFDYSAYKFRSAVFIYGCRYGMTAVA